MGKYLSQYKSVKWALIDQGLVSGCNFITTILLIRFLGLSEYGHYVLLWLGVTYIYSLQESGIISAMMNIAPKQEERSLAAYFGAVVSQHILFVLLSAVVLFIAISVLLLVFPEWGAITVVWPLTFAMVAYLVRDFLRRYLFVTKRPRLAFTVDGMSYAVQIGLILILYFNYELNLIAALWAIGMGSFLMSSFWLIFLNELQFDKDMFLSILSRHWQFAKWKFGATTLIMFSGNVILLIAAGFLGAVAAGLLRALQNIMGFLHVFLQGLANAIPMKISKAFVDHGLHKMEQNLLKLGLFFMLILACFSIPVVLFPNQILRFLCSSGYAYIGQDYSGMLKIYLIVYVITIMTQPFVYGLNSFEHTRPIFIAYIFSLIVSCIIAYPLVIQFKLLGVIIAFIINVSVNFIVILFGYISKRRDFSRLPTTKLCDG